jgi:hypothetical protein
MAKLEASVLAGAGSIEEEEWEVEVGRITMALALRGRRVY